MEGSRMAEAPPVPPQSILENPLIMILAVMLVIFVVGYYLIKSFRGRDDYKYNPIPLEKIANNEMKRKFQILGVSAKTGWFSCGKLFVGINKVADIRKYYITKGVFQNVVYDEKKRSLEIVIDEKNPPVEYDLMFFEAKNKSWIKSFLGLDNEYYIIQYKDKEMDLVKTDPKELRFFLPHDTDLTAYGDVFTNHQNGLEYIQDLGLKFLSEQTTTHLINSSDKVVILEMAQAKRERTDRIYMEHDKGKWDDRKQAGDTTIT
jgi:hypothetical protein